MSAGQLTSKHPQFSEASADWTLMRDAYKGERQVKSKGEVYLPYTQAHIADGVKTNAQSPGYAAYQAYKLRARFPNYVREAIQMAIGMMHSQPAEIKLPKALEKITWGHFVTCIKVNILINFSSIAT